MHLGLLLGRKSDRMADRVGHLHEVGGWFVGDPLSLGDHLCGGVADPLSRHVRGPGESLVTEGASTRPHMGRPIEDASPHN